MRKQLLPIHMMQKAGASTIRTSLEADMLTNTFQAKNCYCFNMQKS